MHSVSIQHWVERISFVSIAGGLLIWGGISGFSTWSVQFDFLRLTLEIILLEAAAAALIFSAFILVTGILFLEDLWDRSGNLLHEGPEMTAIVPVYRDGNVLYRSIESLMDSNYRNLNIVIVCEEDDTSTVKAAKSFEEHDNVDVLVQDAGTKAGAINAAIEQYGAPYIAVFDADEKINPDFLSRAAAELKQVDAVQGRRIPEPIGFVESFSYFEKILFHLGSQLPRLFRFRYALSASTVMKRTVIETVGGYDPDMIGEDLDFAHKCYNNGFTVKAVRDHPSLMEAPHTFQDLWKQKKRFVLARFQLLHKILRQPFSYNSTPRGMISSLDCLISLVGNFLALTLIAKFIILILLGAKVLPAIPLIMLLSIAMITQVHDYRNNKISSISYYSIIFLLIIPFFSLITLKSFLEYLFTWNGEWYHVKKGI